MTKLKINKLPNEQKKLYYTKKLYSIITNDELLLAVLEGNLYQFIIETNDLDSIGCENPLHLAALIGDLDSLVYLIEEKNYNPNEIAESGPGRNLLCCAFMGGNANIVHYLINEKELSPKNSISNDYNSSILHYAARGNNVDLIKYAIEHCNCTPSLKNGRGTTPLLFAAYGGAIEAMECLITDYGVEPTETNNKNETILNYACMGNDIFTVDYAVRKLNLSFDELNTKMIKIIKEQHEDRLFVVSPEIDNYMDNYREWYSFKNKSLKNLCIYSLFKNTKEIIFENNKDNDDCKLYTDQGDYELTGNEAASVLHVIENGLPK